MNDYQAFLARKAQEGARTGFALNWHPALAMDFQLALLEWAVEIGRGAVIADCGLGKSLIELAWAHNVVRHTNKPVLGLTPLAVTSQMAREAAKFGIEVMRSSDGKNPKGIVITNYEKLHLFNPEDYSGCFCDESSILKSFDGATKSAVTEFMRKLPYRLLATATAAPNDYIELGTSSEALGYLGHMDMLSRFFKNDQGNSIKAMRSKRFETGSGRDESGKWRLKGHAELPFWRWVCSWARAIRKPSDLGFDDSRFVLPPLVQSEHVIQARQLADGMLFALPAVGLKEEREERRRTIGERCEAVAKLVEHDDVSVSWCHLNDEGDLLTSLIAGAYQIKGSQSDDEREEIYEGFAAGQIKKLVIKDSIGAFGLNWQHCAHTTLFPSHSFERYYQAIRRFWRFGQTKQVRIDVVTTEGESGILKNMQRKQVQADRMFSNLVAEMNSALHIERDNFYIQPLEVPSWLSAIN